MAAFLPMTLEARTISDFFVSEPGVVFDTLDNLSRMDMIDYYNSGQRAVAGNSLHGEAVLDTLDAHYMRLRLSDISTVEMQLAVRNATDTLIVVVQTLDTPVADSRLTAYNTEWRPVDLQDVVELPAMKDFYKDKMPDKVRHVLDTAVEFPLLRIAFDGGNLWITPSLEGYLSVEDYEEVSPWLKDNIVCVWNGKKFKKQK